MTTVCHLWPGITPWNVWNLRVDEWLMFANAADEYNRQMKESARG